jgi:hypothetical protein
MFTLYRPLQTMNENPEVIAIFLDDQVDTDDPEGIDFTATSVLLRDSTGHVKIRPTPSLEALREATENSGIFKRGEPIVDPVTGDVIGYELEEDERFRRAVG